MDPHTVGGGQQGELFVDDRLDGGNPVAPLADRVDLPLQSQVGVAELGQLRLHRLDPVAQTEFQAARGEGEKGLVAGACVAVGLEIIRVGFKENPEHVAVAFDDVVQYPFERVVTGRELAVFVAQPVGRVLESVFDRGVEKERKADVVEYGGTGPHEQVDRDAHEPLPECPGFACPGCGFRVGHCSGINRFRGSFRASPPSDGYIRQGSCPY